jgi:hypothetical protein
MSDCFPNVEGLWLDSPRLEHSSGDGMRPVASGFWALCPGCEASQQRNNPGWNLNVSSESWGGSGKVQSQAMPSRRLGCGLAK